MCFSLVRNTTSTQVPLFPSIKRIHQNCAIVSRARGNVGKSCKGMVWSVMFTVYIVFKNAMFCTIIILLIFFRITKFFFRTKISTNDYCKELMN